jgi:UDP-glucose 4-epimerase
MKILITGASGYLGGRLALSLSERNKVYLASRSQLNKDLFKHIDSSSLIIDWNDQDSLLKAVNDVDTVIHLAGMNAQECYQNALKAKEVNMGNTASLLSAAIKSNVSHFIYLSTAHVYKNPLQGSFDESSPINGDHPYATSHYLGEKVVLDAHKKSLINTTIIRLSNAFGAPINKEVNCWMLLVNDLCKQLVEKNQMIIRSSGEQRRNFITLTDTCRAIEHLASDNSYKKDPIFNVGSDWTPTIKEIALLVAKRYELITKNKPSINFGSADELAEESKLDYSIEKLKKYGFVLSPISHVEAEIDNLVKSSIIFFGNK